MPIDVEDDRSTIDQVRHRQEAAMAMTMTPTRTRAEVEADIKETLGIVPSFFARMPDQFLAPEWQLMKELEFGETLIPNKYKELIGVGVHSETKCRYCTLFHQEAAKLFGATDAEIQEAVHFAKYTSGWSVYLNGIREDYDRFERELKQISTYLQSKN
jgi:AhpD family alkylhydroperoxidase